MPSPAISDNDIADNLTPRLCFDILALFPDCTEASDLVYELFCDEWTIYDGRVAVQRQV